MKKFPIVRISWRRVGRQRSRGETANDRIAVIHRDLIVQMRSRKKGDEANANAWLERSVPSAYPVVPPCRGDAMSAIAFDVESFLKKVGTRAWNVNYLPELSDIDG